MKEVPWSTVPRAVSPGAFSRSGLLPSPSEEPGLLWRTGSPWSGSSTKGEERAFAGLSPECMRENQPRRLGFEH